MAAEGSPTPPLSRPSPKTIECNPIAFHCRNPLTIDRETSLISRTVPDDRPIRLKRLILSVVEPDRSWQKGI